MPTPRLLGHMARDTPSDLTVTTGGRPRRLPDDLLRQGELIQVTRDQTMAQELVDAGVVSAEMVAGTRLAHTLSSSIGGRQTDPQVTRFDSSWGQVLLLCSDGLIRHVSDDRIRDVLRAMTSAKQACEDLLADALEGGGSDNITIVVARALQREQ